MNRNLLKYVIAREKKSTEEVAEALHLSRQAFNTRLKGDTEFKLSEIRTLETLLNLSNQERNDIFFS